LIRDRALDPATKESQTDEAMRKQFAISLSVFVLLAACATPQVDQSAATFDETAFNSDLIICRGGNFIVASARTIGIAMLGSVYGAAEGAHYGARNGDTIENAAIGAVIGGTIGLTAGAFKALEDHDTEIAFCLAQKGYIVAGSTFISPRQAVGEGHRAATEPVNKSAR